MKMIIGGKSVDSADKKTREVLDPGTMQVIDTVPLATQQDVEDAINCAQKGFEKWSQVPLHTRIDTLRKFHDLFLEEKDWFVEMAAKEMGKTVAHAEAEVINAASLIEHFCDGARTLKAESFQPGDHYSNEADMMITVREPWGVVACVLPFNFPFELYCHKVVPALLMGNAVVVKPASDTPLCNIHMSELLLKAGVEPLAVNIITGSGGSCGNWLTASPKVNAVTFTGSTSVGISIAENCAKNLTKVSLELGGNDSLIILEDADIDYAVSETVNGRAYCAGQVCCANKRMLVQNSIKEEYTKKLVAAVSALKPGNQFDPSSSYGPQVSESAAIEIEEQINKTIEQGGKLLTGGKRFNKTFIEPTVIEVTPDMDVAKDMEIFGPVWPVIGFDTPDDAIAISNASMYGLSGGVITNDINNGMHVAKHMEAGCCVVNGVGDYRAPGQPFGGYKQSGLGAEGGVYTLIEMTQMKSIVLRNAYK
ncbi:MAG: aldehyde dehydrogenase family protein [Anaerovoracaceae bacterium]|jgi:acyl-CoA reductase-like NAD-dependent aldehyde dehydrogenase